MVERTQPKRRADIDLSNARIRGEHRMDGEKHGPKTAAGEMKTRNQTRQTWGGKAEMRWGRRWKFNTFSNKNFIKYYNEMFIAYQMHRHTSCHSVRAGFVNLSCNN